MVGPISFPYVPRKPTQPAMAIVMYKIKKKSTEII